MGWTGERSIMITFGNTMECYGNLLDKCPWQEKLMLCQLFLMRVFVQMNIFRYFQCLSFCMSIGPFVCLFVRLLSSSLSRSINLHYSIRYTLLYINRGVYLGKSIFATQRDHATGNTSAEAYFQHIAPWH